MACRIRSWHTLAEAKEPSYPSLSILDISSLIIVSYFSSISISSQVINVWDRVCTVSPHPQVFPHYTEIHILLRNPLAYKSFLLFKSSAFFIILRIFLLGTLLGTFGRLSPYRRCPLLSFQRFQRFVWNCLLYSSPWSSTNRKPWKFNTPRLFTFVNITCYIVAWQRFLTYFDLVNLCQHLWQYRLPLLLSLFYAQACCDLFQVSYIYMLALSHRVANDQSGPQAPSGLFPLVYGLYTSPAL